MSSGFDRSARSGMAVSVPESSPKDEECAPRPGIIFIGGVGRSGSTLTEIVLSNHDEIMSLGELSTALSHSLQHCACGQLVRQCPFWSDLLQEACETYGFASLDRLAPLVRRYMHILALPSSACGRTGGLGDRARYLTFVEALGRIACARAGARWLVDSSKNLNLAVLYRRRFRERLKVVHLTRHPLGVLSSYMKDFDRGFGFRFFKGRLNVKSRVARAALVTLTWNLYNFGFWLLRRLFPTSVYHQRYEDILAEPRASLEELGSFLGASFEEVIQRIERGEDIVIGHTMAGNVMRMADSRRLRVDPRQAVPPRARWAMKMLVAVLGFPTWWLTGYGMRRRCRVPRPPGKY